jgi:hypothetical protein
LSPTPTRAPRDNFVGKNELAHSKNPAYFPLIHSNHHSSHPPIPQTMKKTSLLLALAATVIACNLDASGAIVVTGVSTYTQNFDTLQTSGSSSTPTSTVWNDNSTLPGWYASRSALLANTGNSNTGGLFSYGPADDSDRALGGLGSNGTGDMAWGVAFQNTSASPLAINSIAFTGEQWRNGGNTTQQSLTFSYQVSSSPITNLTPTSNVGWTSVSGLTFTGPVATGTAAALNGNLGVNQDGLSEATNIVIPAGSYVMLRWRDLNDSGNDHGLAVDDVSVTFIPEPTAALLAALAGLGLVARRRR